MFLSAAFTPNPSTEPILSGAIAPATVTWEPQAVGPGDLFYRQLKFGEFDVSELSISSLTIGISQGSRDWVALPIFTTRAFYHTEIVVRADSALVSPVELRAKRVGVLEYQQTSVVWIRGILETEFGVRAEELEWFMERRPEQSHGGATGFVPPPGVRLSYVPADTSLAAMLADGAIDAILFHPAHVDRIDHKADGARERLRHRPLFADPPAEADRYLAATGIVPVNHTVVVRRSIFDAHPELAADIYETFARARERSLAPYGVVANRRALEMLMQYRVDQGLTSYRVSLDEVFATPSLAW